MGIGLMSLGLRRICRFRAAARVLACAAALAVGLTPALAREFRASDNQAADYPTVQALQFMAKVVEERTGGRHWIRVFHSSQLGEEKETIEQTRIGVIDIN